MTPKSNLDGDLLKNAVLFTITLHRWGNRRSTELKNADIPGDKSRFSHNKKLIESPEFEAIRSAQNEAKEWCLKRCMPSFIRSGIFIVKLDQVPLFEKKLNETNERVASKLLPEFLDNYGKQVDDARYSLGPEFDARDYPTKAEMRDKFGVEWGWIAFTIPDNLPPEIREAEAEKLRKMYEEARVDAVAALREGFKELVDRMVDRLGYDEKGKPRVFRDTLIPNWIEFFDTFNARNLMNDRELAAIVEQAKEILSGIKGNVSDGLRDNRSLRTSVAAKMERLKGAVDGLVEKSPSRRFGFNDEE